MLKTQKFAGRLTEIFLSSLIMKANKMSYVLSYVLFILIIFSAPSTASRIIDRFGGSYPTHIPCRGYLVSVLNDNIFAVKQYMSIYLTHFKRINCTIEYGISTEPGFPDSNGTYNGIIGRIQRNEIHFGHVLARPDSLPFEPARISPVLLPGDSIIVSHKNESHNVTTDLTEFIVNADPLFYDYFLIASFMVVVLLTIMTVEFVDQDPLRIASFSLNTASTCFKAVLKYDSFDTVNVSSSILALSYWMFVFFAVHNLFLSKIGADLVMLKQPHRIDSTEDLVNSKTITPVLIKNLYLFSLMERSRPESQLGRLWSVMKDKQNDSVFNFDLNNPGEANNLFTEIKESRKALLIPKAFIQLLSGPGCSFLPKLLSSFYFSKESFAEGVLTTLYSFGYDPLLLKISENVMRSILEMGLLSGVVQTMTPFIPDSAPGMDLKYNIETIECQTRMFKTEIEEQAWQAFNLTHFRKFFWLLIWVSGLSTCILIFEVLIHFIRKTRSLTSVNPL